MDKPANKNNKLGLRNIQLTKYGTYKFYYTKDKKTQIKYFKLLCNAIEYRDKFFNNLNEK